MWVGGTRGGGPQPSQAHTGWGVPAWGLLSRGFGVFRAVLWRTENRLPAVGRVKVRAPRLPRGWGEVERKPSLPWVGPGAAVGEVPGCVGVWEQERRVLRPPPPAASEWGWGVGVGEEGLARSRCWSLTASVPVNEPQPTGCRLLADSVGPGTLC